MSGRGERILIAAWESLIAARIRAGLAALGLMVGVSAVILMVAVGAGTANQVYDQVTAMGTNLISVRAAKTSHSGARGRAQNEKITLKPSDAAALSRLDGVRQAVPLISKSWQIATDTGESTSTAVAAPPGIFQVEDQTAAEGRLFDAREERAANRVAVVGPSLRRSLAGDGYLVGRNILINKQPFKVVGELKSKGTDPSGEDLDDRVYIPLSTALSRLLGGRRHVDQVVIQVEDQAAMPALAGEIKKILRQRHRLRPFQRDDFRISTQLEILETQSESSRLFSGLITGVAALSLLVAGVGVMAVMLIAVRERTPEIGVRRAVGARRRDVLAQFLLEALLLGLAGGLPGVLLGLGLALGVRFFSDLSFDLPWPAALISLGLCLLIALFFGFWPARKAAALPPAQAVRGA
jgi:putative ABC transport system permease protein